MEVRELKHLIRECETVKNILYVEVRVKNIICMEMKELKHFIRGSKKVKNILYVP